jgi:hypothetical protein
MNYLRNERPYKEKTAAERKFEIADRYLDAYLDKKISFQEMKSKIEKLEIK